MGSKFLLRLPAQLLSEATILAKRQGVELHDFFVMAISEKVTALKARTETTPRPDPGIDAGKVIIRPDFDETAD